MKRILFVDDEVQILKSLKRLFIDSDYDVLTAENGEDALKVLEHEEINLIVSDMRMPYMDGYQLLSKVREKYPKILRVILSGYGDEKIVFKALQQNIIKLYVLKPWNNDALIKLVEQIFETEDLLSNSNLLLLINNFEGLPTIKSSFQRVIEMIDMDKEIAEISREIERDLSISTKVLHLANSAFYGVKTGSVKQALTYLGLKNIRGFILATSIIDSMSVSGGRIDYVEELWKHAFLSNKILLFIYEKCLQKKMPEVANSAGLLHNIGVVFMIKSFSKKYLDFTKTAEVTEGFDIIELERAEFNASHQEAGGYLLRWWDLPFPIVEAALYHHSPFDERIVNSELVLGVHIAQKYAWDMLKVSQSTRFFPEAFIKIGLVQSEFEEKLSMID